jgi:hypothetical protein
MIDEGVRIGEVALADPRRRFLRAEVHNVRAFEVLWVSAPVLRLDGTPW